MGKAPYKLTLHERLNRLPHSDYEIAWEWFPKRLNVHPRTFKRWVLVREDEKLQIPGNAIIQMAIFFNCLPSEMYRTPFNKEELDRDWETFKSQFENIDQLALSLNHYPESHVQD